MRALIIIIIAMLTVSVSFGQTDTNTKFKMATNKSVKKSNTPLTQVTQIKSTTPTKQSDYYWNDQIILEKLTVKTIPVDYPKYNAKLSKPQNLELIDKWMKKNNHMLKDKYKTRYK